MESENEESQQQEESSGQNCHRRHPRKQKMLVHRDIEDLGSQRRLPLPSPPPSPLPPALPSYRKVHQLRLVRRRRRRRPVRRHRRSRQHPPHPSRNLCATTTTTTAINNNNNNTATIASGSDDLSLTMDDQNEDEEDDDDDDDDDDEEDESGLLDLHPGENWLRLCRTVVGGGGGVGNYYPSILDDTQDFPSANNTQEECSSNNNHDDDDDTEDQIDSSLRLYPSILSLALIGGTISMSKDCYLCLDVDGDHLMVKDMRPILDDDDESSSTSDNENEEEEGEDSTGISRIVDTNHSQYHYYSPWERLPRRQVRILRPGDRICTSFKKPPNQMQEQQNRLLLPFSLGGAADADAAIPKNLGLVLEYQYKCSPPPRYAHNGKTTTKILGDNNNNDVGSGDFTPKDNLVGQLLTQPMEDDSDESNHSTRNHNVDNHEEDEKQINQKPPSVMTTPPPVDHPATSCTTTTSRTITTAATIIPAPTDATTAAASAPDIEDQPLMSQPNHNSDEENANSDHEEDDDDDKTVEMTQPPSMPRENNPGPALDNNDDDDDEPTTKGAVADKVAGGQDFLTSPLQDNETTDSLLGEKILLATSSPSRPPLISMKGKCKSPRDSMEYTETQTMAGDEIESAPPPMMLDTQQGQTECRDPEASGSVSAFHETAGTPASRDISPSMMQETGEESSTPVVDDRRKATIPSDRVNNDVDMNASKPLLKSVKSVEDKVKSPRDSLEYSETQTLTRDEKGSAPAPMILDTKKAQTESRAQEESGNASAFNEPPSQDISPSMMRETGEESTTSTPVVHDRLKETIDDDSSEITEVDGATMTVGDMIFENRRSFAPSVRGNEKEGNVTKDDDSGITDPSVEAPQQETEAAAAASPPQQVATGPRNEEVERASMRNKTFQVENGVQTPGHEENQSCSNIAPTDSQRANLVAQQALERKLTRSTFHSSETNQDNTSDTPAAEQSRNSITTTGSKRKAKLSSPATPASKRPRRSPTLTSTPRSTRKRLQTSPGSNGRSNSVEQIRVMATGVTISERDVKKINGVMLTNEEDAVSATHLIAASKEHSLKRTPKLMIALCHTPNIVNLEWLVQSAARGNALDTKPYLLLNQKEAEETYAFDMKKTLARAKELREKGELILMGFDVYICAGVAGNKKEGNLTPTKATFRNILEGAGAKLLDSLPTVLGNDHRTLIITSKMPKEATKQLSVKKVTKAVQQGAVAKTTDEIFHAIMTQQFHDS